MKTIANLLAFSALALALVLVPVQQVSAQNEQAKPAMVISVASINEQLADVSYLLKAAGQDQFVPLLELGALTYVDGFNKQQPMGAFVNMTMGEPSVTAFVAVEDLDKVLMKVQDQTGQPEDLGNGVQKLTAPDGQEIFVKEKGGWAFMSNALDNLTDVPDDPSKALGDLPKDYNVAVQINVRAIPAELRQMAIQQMKDGYEQGLANLDEEDPENKEALEKITANGLDSIEQLVNESDQVTLGWNVDAMARTTYIDFEITAVAGTKLASRMEKLKDTKTNHSGFLLKDAAVNLNFVSIMADQDKVAFLEMLNTMSTKALAELDDDDNLDEAGRTAAKNILSTVFGSLKKTVEGGRLDGGAALLFEGKKLAFVAGGLMAGSAELNNAFREAVDLAKKDAKFTGTVEMDLETHANITFHKLTFPVPDDQDEARDVLGEDLEVYVGIGAESAYIAVGHDSLTKLKQVIDASASAANQDVPPSQMTIALLPILKFASQFPEGAVLAGAVTSLEQNADKDKIRLSSHTVERGARTRIELEEGVLQAIGAGVQAAMQGFGGGGGGGFDDF